MVQATQHRPFGRQPPPPLAPSIDVNEVVRRVRSVEQRMSTLQRQLQVTEQNLIANDRGVHKETAGTRKEISGLRGEIELLKDAMMTLSKEIKRSASREDVMVLKKYLELWQPVKFVTVELVERIIDEKLKKGKP